MLSNPHVPLNPSCRTRIILTHRLHLTSLPCLAADFLIQVFNALTFVWFRWPNLASVGCDLTDKMLIVNYYLDLAWPHIHLESYPSRRFDHNGVRITNIKHQIITRHLSAVSYAINFEHFLKTRAYSNDHVIDQCPSHSMQCAVCTFV